MHVLYDGQVYNMQVAGGINRYFANLISRLPASFTPSLLVRQKREVNYPIHPNLKVLTYKSYRLGYISYRVESWLANKYSEIEECYFKNITALNNFDLAHPTYYSLLTRQEISKYRCPVVITVWDMIHELFPEQIDPHGLGAEEKRRAILAADAIICISENTKRDLLERYSLPERKVKVTHLASEIYEGLSYGPEPVPSQPYYLYVGSRSRYKNFDGLLAAFARTISVQPEARLCVVGQPFSEAELRLMADLKLTDQVLNYGHVADSYLAKLYRCSVAFVYPSLYEGFGIPPLEAMSCGTVVVASDCSSIPEVVGDAGLLFDPHSTEDLADILLGLLRSPAERERLIARGRERARAFSWDKTVAQTIEVYRSLGA
jgi:glycosyltransferase involved in cell wall biosynthesis